MKYTIDDAASDVLEAVQNAEPIAAKQLWRAAVKVASFDAYCAMMRAVEREEADGYACDAWQDSLREWRGEVAR